MVSDVRLCWCSRKEWDTHLESLPDAACDDDAGGEVVEEVAASKPGQEERTTLSRSKKRPVVSRFVSVRLCWSFERPPA